QETAGQLRAGIADVRDITARVRRRLLGSESPRLALARPSILAAQDLTPSEVSGLPPDQVLGICLALGGANSHSVILARALGIPVVAGAGEGILSVPEGTTVALDAERGSLWISPDANQLRDLEER